MFLFQDCNVFSYFSEDITDGFNFTFVLSV